MTTVPAEHKGSRPPPVEKEDGLLACIQGLAQSLLECPAKDATVANAKLLAQIDQADRRQGRSLLEMPLRAIPGNDTLGEFEEPVRALAGPVVGLQVGRSAAEEHRRTGQPPQGDGDIAGVVGRQRDRF
jgi:hypothetical protein